MKPPLILLDVDGAVNHLDPAATVRLRSHGYPLRWPHYMPDLIQAICAVADVWWCSTWREWANDDIAPALGIPPLKVVTDDSRSRYIDWKAPAAAPLVVQAIHEGRRVAWIEDFGGHIPTGPPWQDVNFVDTAETGYVLRESSLPVWLRELIK